MAWLKKIFSKLNADNVEEAAQEVLNTMPTAQCLTAGAAVVAEPSMAEAEHEDDDNPFKQRRYFVKQGRYVDHEQERAQANASSETAEEEIRDRQPIDLKTIFPKLSLR